MQLQTALVFSTLVFQCARSSTLELSTQKLVMEVHTATQVQLRVRGAPENVNATTLEFWPSFPELVEVFPKFLKIEFNESCNRDYDLTFISKSPGKIELTTLSTTPLLRVDNLFVLIKIYKSQLLEALSMTVGWLYFLAWSVSFYPQIYSNYKLKSVVGLNFDYLLFSMFGYIMYNNFNIGLFFIPAIKEQYSLRHPRSLIPVMSNDVLFSTHSIFATAVTIGQCFIYDSGDQRFSTIAKTIVGLFSFINVVAALMAVFDIIMWLDVLYISSYLKLCYTLKKYIPQAHMNYKRKSTVGWHIGNVFLDFTGGVLSLVQMGLNAYNYGDWYTIVENPTKFGLGIITLGFDIIFILQHYTFYPQKRESSEELKKVPQNGGTVIITTKDCLAIV